jgi:SpoIID/LytB domain protein
MNRHRTAVRRLITVSVLAAVVLPVASLRIPVAAADPLPRVRIEALKRSTLLVHGTYPPVESRCVDPYQPILHSRFRGLIEVGKDTDGSLFVINQLGFEDYLKGIAEIPPSWPLEALKAQVVAARTYAPSRLQLRDGTAQHLGYDLCATDACQVYRGVGVERGPWGQRWVQAVNTTRGEALVYQGDPAQTFYFSTSNGHTLGNADVFGGAPLPYLRPVAERDDGASALSHWSVTMPLSDVTRFLRDDGLWAGPAIERISQHGDQLAIAGGGTVAQTSRSDFRSALDASAPCLEPSKYPTGGLPQTIPSVWFSAASAAGSLHVEGRGWGHGVGMVQWGAYGKARRGMGYADILAYYYGGLRPEPFAEPPTIRVLVAWRLRSVTIDPAGPVDAPGLLVGAGPWRLTGGTHLRVRQAGSVEPVLSVKGFRVQRTAQAGGSIVGSMSLERPVTARLVLLTESGDVPLSRFTPFLSGKAELDGRLPQLDPGAYEVAAVVSDGIDEIHTSSTTVTIGEAPTPVPSSPVDRAAETVHEGGLDQWWIVSLAIIVLIVVAMLVAFRAQGRGRHVPRSNDGG